MCWWIHSGVYLFYRHMHTYQWAEPAAETWPLDIDKEHISGWFQDHNLRNAQSGLHLSASCLRLFGLNSGLSIWTPNLVFQVKLCLVGMVAAEKRGQKFSLWRWSGDFLWLRFISWSWVHLTWGVSASHISAPCRGGNKIVWTFSFLKSLKVHQVWFRICNLAIE